MNFNLKSGKKLAKFARFSSYLTINVKHAKFYCLIDFKKILRINI